MNRRDFVAASGLASAAAASARSKGLSGGVRAAMPVLSLHEGSWVGTYTFVSPTGDVLDRYRFNIDVTLSDDNSRAYQQVSRYRWPDGRTENRRFEGAYRDRKIVWDDGRIAGQMWEIDSRSIYLHFRFTAMPGVECHEMIQTFAGGEKRGRTWLWYRDGELYQSVLIDERRAQIRD